MLERCRTGNRVSFIPTGISALDFALLAMEVSFGISSKRNLFQPGEKDYIKPDGLAVRRGKSFCVLEVKGPKDNGDLLDATLQGLCGVLAVYAKRRMIAQIVHEPGIRRPSMKVRGISRTSSDELAYRPAKRLVGEGLPSNLFGDPDDSHADRAHRSLTEALPHDLFEQPLPPHM